MSTRPTTAGWLREQGGRASFTSFMAAALYDSEKGYYSRNISGVGKRGDFSTSATLHPILGQAVAGWIRKQWAQHGMLPVVEIGAGDGSLAHAVSSAFSWWARRKLDYHIVDVSVPLIALQKNKLKGRKVCWHRDMKAALRAVDGKALIFSNELVDAFPCRLLQKTPEGWAEIFLRVRENGIEEELEELQSEVWSEWSACAAGHALKTRQRIEIQESYRDWLKEWLPGWKAGSQLTIDYGAQVEQLYWRRPAGTLRAYFSHHRMEGLDVYARFGQQDLTVDVNFTDLKKWGEALGLKTREESFQREFVQTYAGDFLQRSAGEEVIKFLQDSAGAGEAFRILVQER